MTTKAIAIIAGVGKGTGASVARRFAAAYPVVLLARRPESYESLAKEINSSGGKAIGISADVSNPDSLKAAFSKIEQEFNGAPVAAAVFNASSGFVRKPFLEVDVEALEQSLAVTVKGAFLFAQQSIPGLLKHTGDKSTAHPPTLIFTGATASVKANPLMSAFSPSKFALRALSLNIAKEYASQGIHVAHAVIDGVIDRSHDVEWVKKMPAEAKIDPDGIAEAYWSLHTQSRQAFSNEIDIRPMMEKW